MNKNNIYYRDGGGGVTDWSLKFWRLHRDAIGRVSHVEVSEEPLLTEQSTEGYPLDYNMMIVGKEGTILLSGCNCGYGGTGPNGTRKILEELGVPEQEARRLMYRKQIHVIIDSPWLQKPSKLGEL
jgi:hypothetical protein